MCTVFSGLDVTLCACHTGGTNFTYTINRGPGDWTSVRASVTVRRLINGVSIGEGNNTLRPERASFTVADNQQCRASVEVVRAYTIVPGGQTCRYTQVIDGRTTIVIPVATATATGCTAPAL